MNQVFIVGRIKEYLKIDNNCRIKIAVSRSYKNENGEYETDIIPVMCFSGIAQKIQEYCTEDSLIGIKGTLETREGKVMIMASRVTLLNTAKKEDE